MSGDEGDLWRAMREAQKLRRFELGVECPECKRLRPKTNASILLPQQKCRVDGYRDPRPLETQPKQVSQIEKRNPE